MINSKVDHCKTLEEFYSEIRRQQEEAHGAYYCAQHDAVQKYLKDCESYKELGTHQGGTAAAACLMKPKQIELVDISLEKYSKSKHLFEDYCANNNIKLTTKEISSVDKASVSPCDMLLIDSYHHPAHLQKELEVHSKYVRKYMIMHDTSIINGKKNDSLYQVLVQFTSGITPWIIKERDQRNVGFTVLCNSLNV
jgi:hypothetical protein